MEIKWSDLKAGDTLAFTPEFLEFAVNDSHVSRWFVDEVIPIGIPESFEITEVIYNESGILLSFTWDTESWRIYYDGTLREVCDCPPSPQVFKVVELVGI